MNVRKLSKFGFAILALGTCMANAQTELAHVSGRVTDQSGAAVADAEVEIRNVDTNLSTTVKTNHDALYTFPSLRPGHYKLSAPKPKPKQVCDVGFVFARRSVGVLWPQSHLFRDTRWEWRPARPEHWRSDQRQTSERSPLVLSSEQVKLGLAELEGRDQLLAFLEGALGIRQGELGALRWLSCDFDNMSISVQHSSYWRRGGNLKSTKTEASAKLLPMHPSLKHSLQEWRLQSLYNKPEDFVFPSERLQGSKPLDLASVLKKKIQPAFKRIGITGVGWHTFRHSVGTMLAEMGEHQLTIRDYLRHSNLHVTNKYLQATSKTKRLAQDKLVDAILPTGILPKTNLIQ